MANGKQDVVVLRELFGQEEHSRTGRDLERLLQKQGSDVGVLNTTVNLKAVVSDIDSAGNKFILQAQGVKFTAQQAVSCLVEPQIGDKVLVNGSSDGEFFILEVLVSHKKSIVSITSDELELNVNKIKVHTESVEIESQKWSHLSRQMVFQAVDYELNALAVNIGADSLKSLISAKSEILGDSQRVVTGLDRVQAFNIEYSAEFFARFKGNTTVIDGVELLKTDAKLIMAG